MAQKFLTNIDLNKNQLQNAVIHALATAPSSPAEGQIYYHTGDNTAYMWDGTSWVDFGGDITEITTSGGLTGGGANGSVDVSIATLSPNPAGTYGSTTAIPVVTVNNKGQVTGVTTAGISTSFTISDGVASDTVAGGETLTFSGSTGVTTAVTNNQVAFSIGQDVGTTADVTFNTVSADVTGDLTGNADTATKLATARTIALTGDVAATGVSFDGSANITLTTAIQPNSVELGADTTGDYVASLVAGTGVTLTNNTGETATPTIAIGQSVATNASPTFAGATLDSIQVGITAANEIDTSAGNLIIDSAGGTVTVDDNLVVSGNLTVSGTTTTVNTETVTIADNIILLNSNATGSATENGGIEVERGDDTNVTLIWNETDNKWTVGSETFVAGTFEGSLAASNLTGTVAVSNGGTGASTAAGAKTNLGFITRHAATIGNGADTALVVTHNFNTEDVLVEVYDATSKETVVCDVDRTSVNAVTLRFASAPALNSLRAVVIG